MKKKLNLIFTTMLMVTIASMSILQFGCASTPLKDSLYSQLSKQDLQMYAETLGEVGYYLCAYYANDPKHADKVARLKTIYSAIEKAKTDSEKESIDLAALNDATADIISLLATSELGPVYGPMTGAASKALIALCYGYYKSNVKEDNLETVLVSVCNGVDKAKKNGADFIAEPTEIDKLITLEPSEECNIICVMDKVRSHIDAGGLSSYDKKRLKNRLKELQKQYEKEVAAIEAEFEADGVPPAK